MSKPKLPKTIAGIKVPKGLRQAGWLDDLVASEGGRELLAQAILKAAEAAAAVLLAVKEATNETTGDASQGNGAGPQAAGADASGEETSGRTSRGRRRAKAAPGVDPGTGEPDQPAASGRS